MKGLLDRIEHPRLGLGYVTGEIVKERGLGQASLIAIEDDACGGGRRRILCGLGTAAALFTRGSRGLQTAAHLAVGKHRVTIEVE